MTDEEESGVPWAVLPQRWGHPWHKMCSYLGTFPAALARSLITMLTDEGDVVVDPFSGRGTTLLECRLTGRKALASDLNPIAIALTRAKNASTSVARVLKRIAELEAGFDPLLYEPEAQVEWDDIRLIFHPKTLAELCYLRRKLLASKAEVDHFLIGCVLGIMHGSERNDGTSSYASISMPNTYSMPPNYVRRFVETNQLQRVHRNVFELLRTKAHRLFTKAAKFRTRGIVAQTDVRDLSTTKEFQGFRGRVQLALCSPPYLDVVNYAKQNWIRTWFLGIDAQNQVEGLDDNLTLSSWLSFSDAVVQQLKPMLREDGVAALVIGDVARPGGSVISLAREFLRRVLHGGSFGYVGCVSDRLQTEMKTTRIWNKTKGKATSVDRIILLANEPPLFRHKPAEVALFGDEPIDTSRLDAGRMHEYALRFAGV